jgi:prepilin-type N-terminal cleavage/methylation domain-containing protein
MVDATSHIKLSRKSAFTLVELSIVLVILGLLVGGVLTGQSLIRAAELRSVSTQYNSYLAAVHSFRDKYFALPGDMTNAQSFWGVAHATPATCVTTASTTTATCNGDGNGQILPSTGSDEWFRIWQHLANAGMIEGSYTGVQGSGGYANVTSGNSPRGKLGNSSWFVAYDGSSGSAFFPVALTRNNFRFGGINAISWNNASILKPEELWNIDTKLDDGRPGTGIVTTWLSTYAANCASTSVASTATYVLSYGSASCIAAMALY